MDLNLIKNSWDQASNKLSNHWAISIFKERKEDEKTILEADGIIYSPAGDIKRPYPVFYLDFKLTCTSSNNANEFSMTIKNLDPKVKPILNNSFRYFIIEETNDGNEHKYTIYLKLSSDMKKKTDVSDFLNSIYDELFPENRKNSNAMLEHVNYWNKEIRNLVKKS